MIENLVEPPVLPHPSLNPYVREFRALETPALEAFVQEYSTRGLFARREYWAILTEEHAPRVEAARYVLDERAAQPEPRG